MILTKQGQRAGISGGVIIVRIHKHLIANTRIFSVFLDANKLDDVVSCFFHPRENLQKLANTLHASNKLPEIGKSNDKTALIPQCRI